MKRLLTATLAFTTLTATAFAADVADGTFRGRSSQGYKTRVVVRDGQVQQVILPWKARKCTPHTGYSIRFPHWNYRNDPNGHGIEQPAKLSRFHDGGRLVDGPRNNRAVVVARMTGHFVGADRVVGTQTIRVRTHDRYGRHRCTARMRWSAKRG